MIDALLYAVRDTIRGAGYDYDYRNCEIIEEEPPPRFGNVFVGISQLPSTSEMDNALDEYFGFRLSLIMRITIPVDRKGDQLISRNVFQVIVKKIGLNARAEQLRALMHMNWATLQAANTYLVAWNPESGLPTYGFVEPARYRGMDKPIPVGGYWLGAPPDSDELGVKTELRFAGARRLQPIGLYL